MSAGHWAVTLRGTRIDEMDPRKMLTAPYGKAAISTKATWVPGNGCLTNTKGIPVIFIYSIVLDFIVLCLCAYRLLTPKSGQRSKLMNLLFKDGLIYFVVS